MAALDLAVLCAALWAILALLALRRWAKGFGPRPLFAAPAADPARGVRYAFTRGLAPGAKESVGLHLPSYLAGIAFHAGMAAALGHLAVTVAGLALPGWSLLPLRLLTATGAACGYGLLVKRVLSPHLQCLNNLDDYLANLLCTGLLSLTLAATWNPFASPWQKGAAIVLFAYAPLGKIRHCVFFFSTRAQFGAFFGRRAILPPRS